MEYVYKGKVSSEISTVCALIDQITAELKDVVDETTLFDVRLVLSELMINSCEHGNGNDRRKKVDLSLEVEIPVIRIEVSDQGRGFQFDERAFNPMDLKCSGRGLKIVSTLCDKMQVDASTVTCLMRERG